MAGPFDITVIGIHPRGRMIEPMAYVIARTLETIGTLLIALMALNVHHHLLEEHRLDDTVNRSIRREQIVGMIGVAFVVVGFILELATPRTL
jgi:hypothetical protein